MSAWLRSLGGRITLVTVSVAVLAVLLTGLISLQLVRRVDPRRREDPARCTG